MYDIVLVFYSIAALASALFTLLIVFQKPSRQQQLALLVSAFSTIMIFGFWFGVQSQDVVSSLLGQKLIYAGCCHVYYLMLMFIAGYCGVHVAKWLRGILIAFNMLLMVSIMFFEYHTLYYTSYSFSMVNGLPHVEKGYGILHTLYILSMVGYILAMIMVVIWRIWVKRAAMEMMNAIGMLLIVIFPTVTYVLDKALHTDVQLVPFGTLLAEIMMFVLIYRLRVYDISELAKECAFETMEDSVIVVDKKFNYLDSNPMAKKLYGKLEVARTGDELLMIDDELYSILKKRQSTEIRKHDSIYMAKVKDVTNEKGKLTGYVLWLSDITNERERIGLIENYQRNLDKEVTNKTQDMVTMQENMLSRFAGLMESRSSLRTGHSRRIGEYLKALIGELQRRGMHKNILTPQYVADLRIAAPMHDIGKMKLPMDEDNKKWTTVKEYDESMRTIMREHPTAGMEMVDQSFSDIGDKDFYGILRDVVLYHHERWDGSGYPEGLIGVQIPLAARLVAIPDLYDMHLRFQPDFSKKSAEAAFDELLLEKGKGLDPALVECFEALRSQIIDIAAKEDEEKTGEGK